MKKEKIKIIWYGRCCFLIEINGTKILTDPHDTFDGVDMGLVKADYIVSSSSWHDHGHIGASPSAIIISEPGTYKIKNNIVIKGIQTKEQRGTSNVIFNIKWGKYSITNFADLGDKNYLQKLSNCKKKTLSSTNIAFVRPGEVDGTNMTLMNLALKSCTPQIIIPHHYYPAIFSKRTKGKLSKNLLRTCERVHAAVASTEFKEKQINGSGTTLDLIDYKEKNALMFNNMHKQVKQIT
jgi:hypothetical protein